MSESNQVHGQALFPTLLRPTDGIIVIDHGSRLEESNRWIGEIADEFARTLQHDIVEAAHMELAEPSLATAVAACLARKAQRIIVVPFFLLPGKHWDQDIPELTRQALQGKPDIEFLVTAPLGLHPLILALMRTRLTDCLNAASSNSQATCSICAEHKRCKWRTEVSHPIIPSQ